MPPFGREFFGCPKYVDSWKMSGVWKMAARSARPDCWRPGWNIGLRALRRARQRCRRCASLQAMAHSVANHLGLDVARYDEVIRALIPNYQATIQLAAREVAASGATTVVDLGGGTGALAAALLALSESCRVELFDVDSAMLDGARTRLARFGDRAVLRRRSFAGPLPPCDAVMSSYALHHVPTLDEKRRLYEAIHDALVPRGVFVNVDATMPSEPQREAAVYDYWAAHMARHGIGRAAAFRRFAEWGDEDTYFSLSEELACLESAGLSGTCVWREGPGSVVVARKPKQPRPPTPPPSSGPAS